MYDNSYYYYFFFFLKEKIIHINVRIRHLFFQNLTTGYVQYIQASWNLD